MALHELRVPDIGDFKDVPVVEIPVKPGDLIAEGDTVLVLESDKATLDVPADRGGRVVALALKMADRVAKGTLVLTLEAEAEAAPPPPPAATAGPVPVAPEAAAPVAPSAPAEPLEQPSGIAADLPHASPSVRRMARALGVDLARVTGTGPKGRITSDDVNGFVRAALAAPAAAPAGEGLGLLPWPKVDYAAFGPVERQLLTRIARISGPSLQRNAVLIPHVTNFDEADITDLEAFRKAANAEGGAKLSIPPFAVKAAVAALKRFPAFNASLDGDALVLKRYYNIGVAADTPDGLVVPVVRAADQKSLREIAAEMADLAADARAGRLKAPDMQGATFTISSLGGIGGINFTPIINAPEVAIMGMVRAQTRPLWDGAAFQPRLVQPLSLSWDHRVVDGVAAAKFLLAVKEILGDFRRISL